MKTFHEEVLTRREKTLISELEPLLRNEFYLAGGTALALLLGHRISLDFDLFSASNKLLKNERENILSLLREKKLSILSAQDGTMHMLINGVSISLFHYPYPLISKISGKWNNMNIAGIPDIGAMKLSAVQGRGCKKDFIDLYFIAKEKPLVDLLLQAEKKFKAQENFIEQTCKALTYFKDADMEPIPKMIKTVSWSEIKRFFIREAKKVMKSVIS